MPRADAFRRNVFNANTYQGRVTKKYFGQLVACACGRVADRPACCDGPALQTSFLGVVGGDASLGVGAALFAYQSGAAVLCLRGFAPGQNNGRRNHQNSKHHHPSNCLPTFKRIAAAIQEICRNAGDRPRESLNRGQGVLQSP